MSGGKIKDEQQARRKHDEMAENVFNFEEFLQLNAFSETHVKDIHSCHNF